MNHHIFYNSGLNSLSYRINIFFCFALFFSLALVNINSAIIGYTFLAMLIVSLWQIVDLIGRLNRFDYGILVAAAAFPLCVLINLYVHDRLNGSLFELPARMLLFIPIYLWIRRYPMSINWIITGAQIGVIFSTFYALHEFFWLKSPRVSGERNATDFSTIVLILSAVAMMPINKKSHTWIRQIIILIGSLFCVVLSQTRSALLIYSILLIPIFVFQQDAAQRIKQLRVIAIAMTIAVLFLAIAGGFWRFFPSGLSGFNPSIDPCVIEDIHLSPEGIKSSALRKSLWINSVEIASTSGF